jgi:HEAT repeat protein
MGVFGSKPDVRKLELSQDIDGLIKALQYQEPEVRLEGATALQNFCNADACPALIAALNDTDERVREASILALVGVGENALPLLFNAMGDQSWLVRSGATRALTKLRWSPEDDEIRVCFLFAQGSWTELAGFRKKAIPYLVEGLRDENAGIRKEAARALGTIRDVDGFEPLTRVITDPEMEVRIQAAWALGEIGDWRAIPFLINLFYDNNPQVRNAAADALAVIGMPAFEPLVAALGDPKPGARLAAIRALGTINDARVIPPLIGKLEDAFPEMRTAAALALGEIGEPALPMVFGVMNKGSRIARLACLDALAKSPAERVTAVLVIATKGIDEQIAKKAEIILRKREGLKVWQNAREEDLQSPMLTSRQVSRTFTEERKAFEQIGSQEIDRIMLVLREDDQITRLKTILRMVNEDRPVIEALILILKTKNDEIRRRAVEAIDRLQNIPVSPFLLSLQDNDPFVRTLAARSLGRLGSIDAVIPLLEHACDDRDDFVSGTATEAIARMGTQEHLRVPIAETLTNALTSDSPKVRIKAAGLLGNLGATSAVQPLISLFRDRDDTVRASAAEALSELGKPAFQALIQAAHDPDTRMRIGAITALAEFGNKGETFVTEATTDSSPEVRLRAREILDELREEKVRPAITRPVPAAVPDKTCTPAPRIPPVDPSDVIPLLATKDPNARAQAIQTLAALGEPAFLPLVYAAYHPDREMRIGALEALSRFGTMGAPYIVNALKDPDLDVQHTAYRILNNLDGKYGLPRVGGPAPSVAAPPDTSPQVQAETGPVCDTISRETPEPVYPADIIPLLADPGGNVRNKAIKILLAMGEPAFLPLVYAAYHPDREMRIGALEALSRFGKEGAPYIGNALEDPDLAVQHAAYRILNNLDGKYGLPRVGGPAPEVVTPTASRPTDAGAPPVPMKGPGSVGDGTTSPEELVALLGNPDKDVQMQAAMALALMGSPAIPFLIEAFADENKEIRATVTEIIGGIGSDAVEPLMQALRDPRNNLVSGAASALGKIGDTRAVPALIPVLSANRSGTGIAAAEALGYLGDSQSVDALITALNSRDSNLQSGAARALGYIGDERAVSVLIESMASEDYSVRRIAIDALIGIGEPSVPYLLKALLHHVREVRSGAAECFRQMDYTPATVQEQINLTIANEEWLEAVRFGPPALEALVRFAMDSNEEVRGGAILALGRMGGPRAIDTLIKILSDDSPLARREATGALIEIGETAVPGLETLSRSVTSSEDKNMIDQVLGRIHKRSTLSSAPG